MEKDEKIKKLMTLPWQALFDIALFHGVDEDSVKGKEKNEIIEKVLLCGIQDEEIERLVDDYVYGNRVTFTLWGFDRPLTDENMSYLLALEGKVEPWIDSNKFRHLRYVAVKDIDDRLELLYTYGKLYNYVSEEGKAEQIWELHRGCLWIGKERNYVASISKHEKMMQCVIKLIAEKLGNNLTQIKPPKRAIDRCTNAQAMSRIVLQGLSGEKTAISNPAGFTEQQEDEMQRIRGNRFDTSGSYIASINDNTTATVKYNMNKGNLGIYKHLPSSVLFAWSKEAIEIILEEINSLKGNPAEEIFKEMGVEIKWNGVSTSKVGAYNWILTQVISSLDVETEYRIPISPTIHSLLNDEKVFMEIPQVFCHECGTYEVPYCANCGSQLTFNRKGQLECSCNAPISIMCGEGHRATELKSWYIPKPSLLKQINNNIAKIYNHKSLSYQMCVMDDELCIIHNNTELDSKVEILFEDVDYFKQRLDVPDNVKTYAVRMKEKCAGKKCSFCEIRKCLSKPNLVCLPKVFYGALPGFRPQPHKGGEFGDVSAQISVLNNYYQMIGIIKKNTENKASTKSKTCSEFDLIDKPLLSTSREGQEIIRQFVEQGMIDSRVDVIAVVAPQYFDNSLKGTLLFLARLMNKKVMFVGLDEICRVITIYNNLNSPKSHQITEASGGDE